MARKSSFYYHDDCKQLAAFLLGLGLVVSAINPSVSAERALRSTAVTQLLATSRFERYRQWTDLMQAIYLREHQKVAKQISIGADVNYTLPGMDTPLRLALNVEDVRVAEMLLHAGANPDVCDDMGSTPLMQAVKGRNLKLVSALLRAKANVNAISNTHDSPILIAAEVGNPEILELLLRYGANHSVRNSRGQDSLWVAVEHKRASIVPILLRKNIDSPRHDQSGRSLMTLAAENGDSETIRLLARYGFSVNTVDRRGRSPLKAALFQSGLSSVLTLFELGADLRKLTQSDLTTIRGRAEAIPNISPEFMAQLVKLIDVSTVNRPRSDGRSPIHDAAMRGETKALKEMLKNKNNINLKDRSGYTPLHWAVQNGKTAAVLLLIERGADINLQNVYGATALHLASGLKDVGMVKVLLQHGAKVDIQDNHGSTPMRRAVDADAIEVVRLLIKAKANPNIRDDHGFSPYNDAVRSRKDSIVKLLIAEAGCKEIIRPDYSFNSCVLEMNASLDHNMRHKGEFFLLTELSKIAPDQHRLNVAAGLGQLDRVRSLLNAGVRPTNRSLSSAIRRDDVEIIKMLVKHGADVNEPDNFFHRAPVWHAVDSRNLPALETLLQLGAKPDVFVWSIDTPNSNRERRTPITEAIFVRGQEFVELLLRYGADPNLKLVEGRITTDGETYLIRAINKGAPEIVDLLLKYRADPNFQDSEGWTALRHLLHRIASMTKTRGGLPARNRESDKKMVSALLRHGARVDIDDANGGTPLQIASGINDADILQLLLEKYSQSIVRLPQSHPDRATYNRVLGIALLNAVAAENPGSVRLLLQMGADPNLQDTHFGTPVVISHLNSSKTSEIAMIFFSHGADPNMVASFGDTALNISVWKKYRDLSALLLKKGADPNVSGPDRATPFNTAIGAGDRELVRLMIAHGADVNRGDIKGWTPLMHFAHAGNLDGVRLLMQLHADESRLSVSGETALMIAVKAGHPEVAKQFSANARTINQQTNLGKTPLHQAVENGRTDLVTILLDAGADVEARNRNGLTPYLAAVESGHPGIIKLLQVRGADTNARTRIKPGVHPRISARYYPLGRNALMIAASRGSEEIVRGLISTNPGLVNAQDNDGNTALMYAIISRKPNIAKLLVANGAQSKLSNRMGISSDDMVAIIGASLQ